MKIKFLSILALMLCMGVFLFPTNAYAALRPPTVQADVSGNALRIEAQSGSFDVEAIFINGMRFNFRVNSVLQVDLLAFEDEEEIIVYAVDFAGNRSNVVTVANPHYVSAVEPPTNPTPPHDNIPVTPQGNPFTPEGQAAVLDHATDGDNKEFFTFQTPAGNVFFLIVDHQRQGNNVYFLNAVTERDLMELAEQSGVPVTDDSGGIPVSPSPGQNEPPPTETPPPEEAAPPTESGGGNGTMIFLLVAIAVAGGAGYYLKIVRPKQQAGADDDYADEDEPEQDLGEEMEFETEREDVDEDELETEDDGL